MSLTKLCFSAEKWDMLSSIQFSLKCCGVRRLSVVLRNLHSPWEKNNNPCVFRCNEKQYFLGFV